MAIENYSLIISVEVKKGYDLPHFVRLTEEDIEIIKHILHLNTIEEVVKSVIKKKGYKKYGYYKYNGTYHLLQKIK